MGWTITGDHEAFEAAALPLLLRDPVANTVALSVLDSLRRGHHFGEQPATLAWYTERGEVTGAVMRTPPWALLLAVLPLGSEPDLVAQLRRHGVQVPSVNGTEEAVRRFSACWTAGTELAAEARLRQRLFRLDRLVPPEPAPAGSARLAGQADLDLLVDWLDAFGHEAESHGGPPNRSLYADRVERGLVWFWLDEQGDPVSFAGRTPAFEGVSRIGPVYTPPAHRRHGYAAGVTTACTRHALNTGAEQVILFTDLANPTSNAIYQRLGYRPIDDRMITHYR